MCSRGKLMVQKVLEKNICDNILQSTKTTNVMDTKCFSDANENQVLFEVPLDEPFELPENIQREIKNNEILIAHAIDSSEQNKLDSENLNKTIEIQHEKITMPLDESAITLKHLNAANDNNNAETNKLNKENENEGFSKELFQLGDSSEHFDENLREKNESESDFDINKNHKEDRKRKLKFSRKLSQMKRLRGEQYTGYSRSSDGKVKHNKSRQERTLKCRCSHVAPKKITPRTLRCANVTEDSRQKLFDFFWKLPSWDARKSYLQGLVTSRDIIRRRKETNHLSSRKSGGYDCYMPTENGEKLLICRTMLLNSLDLGRDSFQRWCKTHRHQTVEEEDSAASVSRKATNGKQAKKRARNWLQTLPKVPSHYCRASTKKLYLESVFRSKLHVYQEYTRYCQDNSYSYISRTLFRTILNEENIIIHKPRKDQCDTCCSWKTHNISEEEYREHIEKKKEAEAAKKLAKESANDEKLVVTMDLQSVLLAPKLEASAIYYKQKLQVHNFTVYALNDKKVDLYVWREANGNVTSNEFTTCIVNYIKMSIENKQSYKHVVLISDGCGYQNRNKVLSSALLNLAVELQITIEQLVLERGHTMMEADAVHSSLEAYFKPPIYAPSDYVSRMRQARNHHPYNVHSIDYTFFLDYENVQGNRKSIRPGRVAKVTDLRALLYLPSGQMRYKLRHNEPEWSDFECSQRNIQMSHELNLTPVRLYERPIKISKQKYQHLQELKSVVERDYHPFYDNLPHHN